MVLDYVQYHGTCYNVRYDSGSLAPVSTHSKQNSHHLSGKGYWFGMVEVDKLGTVFHKDDTPKEIVVTIVPTMSAAK